MILDKIFSDLDSLNAFVDKEHVKVISIETVIVKENTGFPLPHGGTFIAKMERLKLWYEANV